MMETEEKFVYVACPCLLYAVWKIRCSLQFPLQLVFTFWVITKSYTSVYPQQEILGQGSVHQPPDCTVFCSVQHFKPLKFLTCSLRSSIQLHYLKMYKIHVSRRNSVAVLCGQPVLATLHFGCNWISHCRWKFFETLSRWKNFYKRLYLRIKTASRSGALKKFTDISVSFKPTRFSFLLMYFCVIFGQAFVVVLCIGSSSLRKYGENVLYLHNVLLRGFAKLAKWEVLTEWFSFLFQHQIFSSFLWFQLWKILLRTVA